MLIDAPNVFEHLADMTCMRQEWRSRRHDLFVVCADCDGVEPRRQPAGFGLAEGHCHPGVPPARCQQGVHLPAGDHHLHNPLPGLQPALGQAVPALRSQRARHCAPLPP